MFERFTRQARAVVQAARGEAEALGAPAVEAEHLLLALSRLRHPALAGAGLDPGTIGAALAHETEEALSSVGIAWDEPPRPRATATAPPFAASARLALERSLPAALARRDSRITDGHVLLGVLTAEIGTVPRALALAGVDRAALARDVRT